jgi:hypothetical protein
MVKASFRPQWTQLPKRALDSTPTEGLAKDTAADDLRLLERRLIRQRVLRIALNPVERGILHLFCRLNLQARSEMLRSALTVILHKASHWLAPSFVTRALAMGGLLAAANVKAALMMGNRSAASWADDMDYILLLGTNGICQR